jgi:hypothetical protein
MVVSEKKNDHFCQTKRIFAVRSSKTAKKIGKNGEKRAFLDQTTRHLTGYATSIYTNHGSKKQNDVQDGPYPDQDEKNV